MRALTAGLTIVLAGCATMGAPGDLSTLQQEVMATERAFARTMAERDHEAVTTFLADETVFFDGASAIRGKAAVAEAWRPFFDGPDPPFSWDPDQVEVLESGSLALSTGPVLDPQGNLTARFTSIWRREGSGRWRIVFDRGNPVCPCPTLPRAAHPPAPADLHTLSRRMDPTQRFTDRVADYVRYRPGYPEGVLEILRAETDLDSRAVVADIGSGTGISTELFLRNGNTVYAVEPNRAMREAAEAVLGGRAGFRSVDGSAEATTLPDDSVDYAVAGQAFHWFDAPRARREFGRILRISGWSVLLWNDRRIDSTPFLRDYEALLIRFGTDYTTVQHRNVSHERLASFFGPNGFTTRRLYNEQRFDFDGLKGRLLSSSYVPAPGHPDHPPMMEDLKRKFERHEDAGEVTFEYDTVVHFGRMG